MVRKFSSQIETYLVDSCDRD